MIAPSRKERWWYRLIPSRFRCSFCKWPFHVRFECSRTMYHWDGQGTDPNADVELCRQCAEAHHEYWDAMWLEVSH